MENLEEIKNKVNDLSRERRWAMSCYIPVLNVVTCMLCSVRMVQSQLCRFHARQGMVLFAFWFLTIIIALFSQVLSLMLWGVVLLLHGVGIAIAYNGKEGKIPMIASLAMKIPEYHIFTLLTGKSPSEIENKINN